MGRSQFLQAARESREADLELDTARERGAASWAGDGLERASEEKGPRSTLGASVPPFSFAKAGGLEGEREGEMGSKWK